MSHAVPKQSAEALALLAAEWFKTTRRLSRVIHDTSPARSEQERALLCYSQGRVEEALAGNGIRLVIYDGMKFSAELPVEPVNPEDFDTEEGLVVHDTLEPTVIFEGRVLARGLVVLAKGA